MSVGSSRPLRARSATEKNRRRDDILRAAERLWATASYSDLSMNQVARESQLAKGTLYLYFDTKEDLFLALLTEHLVGWLTEIRNILQTRQPRTAAEITAAFMDSIEDKPQLRRLLLLLSTMLGRQLMPNNLQNFRRELRQPYEQVVALLPYDQTTNKKIMGHFYALSVGWQQVADDNALTEQNPWSPEEVMPFNQSMALALEAVIERLAQQDGHSKERAL